MSTEIETFTKLLPKVELHVHLSGSISRHTLHTIWQDKKRSSHQEMELDDPLIAIPPAKTGIDIATFFPIFDKYMYNLITTPSDIGAMTRSVLEDFARDGIAYLELRTTPRAIPSTGISKDDYVTIVLDAIGASNHSQDAMHTFLILSIDRRNTIEEAEEVVDIALKNVPRGVVAIDLCGNPLKGDVSIFRSAFERARAGGLKVTVHFGEVPASGTKEELEMLLSFQPDRLGHVIHVPDEIKEEIKRRKLGLELCLSCNVLAKMTDGGYVNHHFGEWKASGCPIALSTDDVGIFESPLSEEFALVSKHFGLSKRELLRLAREAAECSFGSEAEKARMFALLSSFAQHGCFT